MRLLTFLFIIALSFSAIFSQNKSNDSEATKQLYALFDAEWERGLRENPTFASSQGRKDWNRDWTDNSLQAIERRHQENIKVLEKLKKN